MGASRRTSPPEFDALNSSIAVDFRLWPYDVRLSKAWAVALYHAGVLSLDESNEIERGLDRVAARLQGGEAPAPTDEDVHTLIDRLLHEEIGDAASKLHTGRSRNDQVATATRLWAMDAAKSLDVALKRLQQTMIDQAHGLETALMPSYTHMQRAIPVSAAHWLLSHFWPLAPRSRPRTSSVARRGGTSARQSGAAAGAAYPVSRVLLKQSLGFSAISQNSIDAVSDRDFVAELLFAATMIGTHLSRLAEDLIIYGSSEFGFVQFGDRFTSGSSMMPQKRNPDALELARGSAARMLGDLTTLLATLKGLPSSYNKDLQDDKRVLFDAVDTLLLVLPAVAGALEECEFNTQRMRGALSSDDDGDGSCGLSGSQRRDVPRRTPRGRSVGSPVRGRTVWTGRAAIGRVHRGARLVRGRRVRRAVPGAIGGVARGGRGNRTRRRACSARSRATLALVRRSVPNRGVTAIDDSIAVTSLFIYTRIRVEYSHTRQVYLLLLE